jgi:hypothetical protein
VDQPGDRLNPAQRRLQHPAHSLGLGDIDAEVLGAATGLPDGLERGVDLAAGEDRRRLLLELRRRETVALAVAVGHNTRH